MLTQTFNQLVNPLYPFASLSKEWLNGELENVTHQDAEQILMTAHVFLKKNNGLLVISNRRIIIYQTKNNSLFKRALSFGWGELKGAVIGAIPGVGELMDAKDTVSYRLKTWKSILNRKGAKLKEAKEEREELNKLAEILHLPDNELLDTEKHTLIFQDNWDALAQIIHGVRITKDRMQFELTPGMKTVDQDQYKSLIKKSVRFYHQDISFILSSLIVPYREGLKKRGWDLFFDGENMLITKEEIEDPALEEVMEEVKKVNFFGVFPQDFNFEAGVDRPW